MAQVASAGVMQDPVVEEDTSHQPFEPCTTHLYIDPYADMISLQPPKHAIEAYENNQKNCPLLRLPAEIRQIIYVYTLGNLWITIHDEKTVTYVARPIPSPLVIPIGHESRRDPLEAVESQRQHNIFALPKACRQLYAECHLLVYSQNIFNFPDVATLGTFEVLLSDECQTSDEAGYVKKRAIKRVVVPFKSAEWISEGSNLPFTFLFPELQMIYGERDRVRNEWNEDGWRSWLEKKEREYQERWERFPPCVRVDCLDKEVQILAEAEKRRAEEAEAMTAAVAVRDVRGDAEVEDVVQTVKQVLRVSTW